MSDAMVTGRMPEEKKRRALRILARNEINASQAINALFDRIIAEDGVGFLIDQSLDGTGETDWLRAAQFVDSLSSPLPTQFDEMSKAEIKSHRIEARK